MKKKLISLLLTGVMAVSLAACASSQTATAPAAASSEATPAASVAAPEASTAEAEASTAETESSTEDTAAEGTEIQVFIAASLNTVMTEIAAKYNETHPDVSIVYNADSSGKLLTQIQEGYECDIFFSAAQGQMNTLEEEGMLVEGTRANVVNNQVVVITYAGSGTVVTGLANIADASSIALADGSVPVGRYTRVAMIAEGLLPENDDPASITTAEISEALGGVEISEQGNVSQVLQAVSEQSCEVGTTYYSDTYGYEDRVEVLETVSYDLSGNVIYPIARVVNEEADDAQNAAADEFLAYVLSDECKAIFDSYYFDTNVQ